MSRILLMGAPYQVLRRDERSVEECFNATGRNTGNLLIGNGLVSHLEFERMVPYTYSMSAAYIEENFDRVAIAAANFLHPKFDFSVYSEMLEKISLPVLMVGLGAQSPSADMDIDGIPPGTWRLVEIAAERSTNIGVRGAYTAELLHRRGIRNVRITGCPSLYTDAVSTRRISRPAELDPAKVLVNGSRNVTGHSYDKEAAARVEKAVLEFAMREGSRFVYQNEEPEMQISRGEEDGSQAQVLEALSKFFAVSVKDFQAYIRSKGATFFSVAEWFEWVKEYDFSFGTRFHGNLAALLNGVPAVVIAHDSRTRELCEFAAIPHVLVEDVGSIDPQALYDAANYDLFEERYNTLARRYVEFLEENGVSHKFNWQPDLAPRGRLALSRATAGA